MPTLGINAEASNNLPTIDPRIIDAITPYCARLSNLRSARSRSTAPPRTPKVAVATAGRAKVAHFVAREEVNVASEGEDDIKVISRVVATPGLIDSMPEIIYKNSCEV